VLPLHRAPGAAGAAAADGAAGAQSEDADRGRGAGNAPGGCGGGADAEGAAPQGRRVPLFGVAHSLGGGVLALLEAKRPGTFAVRPRHA